MKGLRAFETTVAVFAGLLLLPARGAAQQVAAVEIRPSDVEAAVGEEIRFTAVGKDAAGRVVVEGAAAWFAAPFDLAAAEPDGRVTVYGPGVVQVGAVVGGQVAFTTIRVSPAPVASVAIESPARPLVPGGAMRLVATPRTADGTPRHEVAVTWSSSDPAVVTVDAAGLATGVAPGGATVRATSEGASGEVAIQVAANPVRRLEIEPRSATAGTGDVVRLAARARDGGGRRSAIRSCAGP